MFRSDNAAPAHPKVLDALIAANRGDSAGYGADPWSLSAERRLRDIFETDCAVFLVATGTAANALSLAALTPPWGAVMAHQEAHVVQDEGGAPEFYMGGGKILLLPGPHAKIAPATLDAEASRWSRGWVHGAQPFAVTISQATESGAVYQASEVGAVAEVAKRHGLKLHMDGARFGNAVVSTGASPAELTWKAGVDLLSFGATKGGALGVEAIVCFDAEAAKALPHLRKRAGHLLSKSRMLGAQMDAFLDDGLWLDLARRANATARALAAAFEAAGVECVHPVEANEVFARLSASQSAALQAAGVGFYNWAVDGPDVYRFVASWAAGETEVAAVAAALQGV